MFEYTFAKVDGWQWHGQLETLYRAHYAEMQARLRRDGIVVSDYNPRLDQYKAAIERGDYLTFIVLENETVIGYCNVWLTNDMHCGDLIAQEDAIYITPEHRRGVGKQLVKTVLDYLQSIGVRRVNITPVTDLRVGKIWRRMGFKPMAELMTYTFERPN